MSGRLPLARLAVAMALVAAPVAAHSLPDGTARVSLRDRHVEVQGEWDLFLLADATPTAIATATEADLAAHHAALRRAVVAGSSVRVDGRSYALEVTGFPAPKELRAMAASLSAEGKDHGALVRVRLESRTPIVDARAIHAAFPPRLGPVVATFVQPATVYLPPGAHAVFDVLAPREDPSRRASPARPLGAPFAWSLGGLGALLVTAFALGGLRRKNP